MRWNNRLAAAAIMSTLFVAGGVAGGAIVYALEQGDAAESGRPDLREGDRSGYAGRGGGRWGGDRPGDPRAFMESRALDEMAKHLGLTETQRTSVEAIFERQRTWASRVMADIGPRMRALLDSANAEIRQTLTEEQQAVFDVMVREDRVILGQRYGRRGNSSGDRR